MENLNKIKSNPFKYAEKIPIKELELLLKELSDAYYNTGKSPLPDKIYDGLIDILEKRDKNNKLLGSIGAKTKRSIKLPYFTGSLDKIKPDSNVVSKWVSKYPGPYILSDKLDGVSCVIVKKDFGLKLYTRGDGEYGSDITHLKDYVLNKEIDTEKIPINTVIRGELIISKTNFEKIEGIMENARNAVSGAVNSKKINKKVASIIDFIAYSIMYPELIQIEQFNKLGKYGFNVVTNKCLNDINNDILSKYLVKRRNKSIYEIDGIVVVDSSKSYKITKSNPDYAFAFKSILTNETAEVQVTDVEWNASKDGYLKPQIKIKPVKLSGVTISSLTGFNAKYIKDNIIGPGSILEIIRSGDVIPHIRKVIEPSINNNPQMPDVDYEWNKTGVDIITKDKTNNDDITIKRIAYFFKTLNIKNIDEKIIDKLVTNGIDNIPDILTKDKNYIISIEGIGDRLIDKIRQNSFDKLNNTKIEILMAASQTFGRGLAIKKFKKIIEEYPDVIKLAKYKKNNLIDIITDIDGFDSITAKQFANGIKNFVCFYEELNNIVNLDYLLKKNKKSSDILKNQTIVFTGIRNKEAESFIEKNGGKVSSSVSKNTTILIHADNLTNLTNKMKDAKDKGIELMSISDFINKYKI